MHSIQFTKYDESFFRKYFKLFLPLAEAFAGCGI